MKKIMVLLLAVALVAVGFVGCGKDQPSSSSVVESPAESPASVPASVEPSSAPVVANRKDSKTIILATTTSTFDSGLLDAILPIFTTDTGIVVDIISVGTGQAIRMGEDGEADVLLVHDTASEEKFVADGHSDARRDVMYNDYVLVGPKDDPNGITASNQGNIGGAMKAIADGSLPFVSRGDDSGTHKKELRLWEAAEVTPEGDWYQSVGKGMGDTLQMASELKGYTLSDRATYLKMKDTLELEIAVEGDETMFNQYGVLVVDPSKNEMINNEGAIAFADWIVSEAGQKAIGEFVEVNSGLPLFTPNAA